MQQSSATDRTPASSAGDIAPDNNALGPKFAETLARKDFDGMMGLLAPRVDFRGLTPGGAWEATDSRAVVHGILREWFEDTDELEEIVLIEVGGFADRHRVTYRFRGHNADGPFVVEQQAYYTESDGRINWMRVLCSGFRPD